MPEDSKPTDERNTISHLTMQAKYPPGVWTEEFRKEVRRKILVSAPSVLPAFGLGSFADLMALLLMLDKMSPELLSMNAENYRDYLEG